MDKIRNRAVELASVCLQMGWYPYLGKARPTLPIFLEGVPGCAKTQGIERLAKILNEEAVRRKLTKSAHTGVMVLPQTPPEEFAGIPSMTDGELVRHPISDIKKLRDAGWGVWMGDEATSCAPATGAAAMALVQDKRAGDVTLSNTIGVVMAFNPSWCAAAGRDFSAPEINRGCLIKWTLPEADWLDYERGGDGLAGHIRFLAPDWEENYRAMAVEMIGGFIEKHPSLLNTMEGPNPLTTEANCHLPWASPRQWSSVIRLLSALFSLGEAPNSTLCMMALEGLVGEGVAKQVMTYIRDFDLVEPEKVLAEAMREGATDETIKAIIPERIWSRSDKLRTQLRAVATAAQQDREDRPARWTAAFRVISPTLTERPDEARLAANILAARKPAGVAIPDAAKALFDLNKKAGLMRSA